MARPFRRRVDVSNRPSWRTVGAHISHVLNTDLEAVQRLKLDEALLWWVEAVKINNPKAIS